SETIQLRTRLKLSAKHQLSKSKKHHLSVQVEFLFSTTKHIEPFVYWGNFGYSDTRLNVFYSYSIPKPNLTLSVGYMLNLIGINPVNTAHHFSVDLVWKNP